MISIGVDLGGKRIKLGILKNDKITASKLLYTSPLRRLKGILPILEEEIQKLLNEKCKALAFAFPGIIDSVNKKNLTTNENMMIAINIDLADWHRNNFNILL